MLQKSLIIRGGTEFKRTVSQFIGASVLLIGVRACFKNKPIVFLVEESTIKMILIKVS